LKVGEAKRLKALEQENTRLRLVVAEGGVHVDVVAGGWPRRQWPWRSTVDFETLYELKGGERHPALVGLWELPRKA